MPASGTSAARSSWPIAALLTVPTLPQRKVGPLLELYKHQVCKFTHEVFPVHGYQTELQTLDAAGTLGKLSDQSFSVNRVNTKGFRYIIFLILYWSTCCFMFRLRLLCMFLKNLYTVEGTKFMFHCSSIALCVDFLGFRPTPCTHPVRLPPEDPLDSSHN